MLEDRERYTWDKEELTKKTEIERSVESAAVGILLHNAPSKRESSEGADRRTETGAPKKRG